MFSCTKNCKMEKRIYAVTFSLQRVISRITRNLKYSGKLIFLYMQKRAFSISLRYSTALILLFFALRWFMILFWNCHVPCIKARHHKFLYCSGDLESRDNNNNYNNYNNNNYLYSASSIAVLSALQRKEYILKLSLMFGCLHWFSSNPPPPGKLRKSRSCFFR